MLQVEIHAQVVKMNRNCQKLTLHQEIHAQLLKDYGRRSV